MDSQPTRPSGVSKRGFASMDPSEKRSFSQDRSLAAQAGRKGGEASHGAKKDAPSSGEAE